MEKTEEEKQLEDEMWALATKHGQEGDTYKWTLMITRNDADVHFEGGCNY